MSQQIQTPAVSQTIGPELLALLWALKIDITGLADMPPSQARDAVCERIDRVLGPRQSGAPPSQRICPYHLSVSFNAGILALETNCDIRVLARS